MKNVGEKLTDEEAEKMVKEIDVDDASGGARFGTNRNRTVKPIVEVVHNIPMEVENAQMGRIRGTSR